MERTSPTSTQNADATDKALASATSPLVHDTLQSLPAEVKCGNELDKCAKPGKLRCGGCKSTMYCSVDCQKVDWRRGGHNQCCAIIAETRAIKAERDAAIADLDRIAAERDRMLAETAAHAAATAAAKEETRLLRAQMEANAVSATEKESARRLRAQARRMELAAAARASAQEEQTGMRRSGVPGEEDKTGARATCRKDHSRRMHAADFATPADLAADSTVLPMQSSTRSEDHAAHSASSVQHKEDVSSSSSSSSSHSQQKLPPPPPSPHAATLVTKLLAGPVIFHIEGCEDSRVDGDYRQAGCSKAGKPKYKNDNGMGRIEFWRPVLHAGRWTPSAWVAAVVGASPWALGIYHPDEMAAGPPISGWLKRSSGEPTSSSMRVVHLE
jgi:hypothetical protein